jgi:squalene-hopene/tetraprenyl-beta-curcumene cyclase
MTGAVSIAETRREIVASLLRERTPDGHWEGQLSGSALSTATAIVALALSKSGTRLVDGGVAWLLEHQNDDGGWGDTVVSFSNISTTALVWAALALVERTAANASAVQRAEAWLGARAGGIDPPAIARAIVARYGKDRTFSVPILTMCALTGRLGSDGWRHIPQLPFELSVIPRQWFTVISLPVVSYALPALIAMGLVRHVQRPSRNPVTRAIRNSAAPRALRVLATLQPVNGGFLEAAPLTSFVAMALIGAGCADHPVVHRSLDFLRASARADGSWPIDTNLATWLTTLAVGALGAGGRAAEHLDDAARKAVRRWLLAQQTRDVHAYTGAAAGAWSWTDLPGGVPDADDTPGALLALHALGVDGETTAAAARGVTWLLDLQNRDGGVPTFCRGWGALPFDRSGSDLTAHAIRAWLTWRPELDASLQSRIGHAVDAGLAYLARAQRSDGAFIPLWFGNQYDKGEENPVYGTSKVVLALQAARDAGRRDVARSMNRAIGWLIRVQNADGGWGGNLGTPSSLEETSLAVAALTTSREDRTAEDAAFRGAAWIEKVTRGGTEFTPSPIGFYFAKLWYFERLYPLIFATEALGRWERFSKSSNA